MQVGERGTGTAEELRQEQLTVDFWSLPCRPMLDVLLGAVGAFKAWGDAGLAREFEAMNERERIAFDLWLVRMGDPLQFEEGSTAFRFRVAAKRMVKRITTAQAVEEEVSR